jgi:serine/threonine-protein kinase
VGDAGQQVLAGRYELEELIAVGGMGEVWRGRDRRLGRSVAVKLLRSEYTSDPTFLARFRAEATHAAALSHPNIASVYDYGEASAEGSGEHLAYLVMELVNGQPLSERLREEGPLSPEATVSLLEQAASALAEAHQAGLVHRDVKPANILLRPDDSVKLTDFGIAWSASSVPLTKTGMIVGTPQYLSPEQAVGDPASPASDVYSLGLVGYECLTGHAAFDGDNPIALALKQVNEEPQPLPADVPDGVRSLIDAALIKDPHERIPDGAAFALAAEQTGDEPPLEPATALMRPAGTHSDTAPAPIRLSPAPAGRRRRWARLALVPLLLVFLGLGTAAAVSGLAGSDGTARPATTGASLNHVSVSSPSGATPSSGRTPAGDQPSGTGGPAPKPAAQTGRVAVGSAGAPASTVFPATGAGTRSVAAGSPSPTAGRAPSPTAGRTAAGTTTGATTATTATTAATAATATTATTATKATTATSATSTSSGRTRTTRSAPTSNTGASAPTS